jgi:hypothetical protein
MSTKTMANRPIAVIIAAMLAISIVFVSLDNNSNNISSNSSTAFAQPHFRFNPFREAGNYTFGAISSVQDDNNGKPAWILTGFWKTNLINHTSTKTPTSNANDSTLQGETADVFTASFRMIMTNGSAMHTHSITNFVLQNKFMPNKTTIVFNGTASASLREGILSDVPTSIKVMDGRVISIWLDPAKVKNHYGNTPIFGIVFRHEMGPPPPFSLMPPSQPPNMRMPVH